MDHFDAIFWIEADDTVKVANSFRRIAQKFGLVDSSEAEDEVITRKVMMDWLSNPQKATPSTGILNGNEHDTRESTKARWLMIYDNADDAELLHDFWPPHTDGSVLITSRDPLGKSYLYPHEGADLEPFTPNGSAIFLQNLSLLSVIESTAETMRWNFLRS